MPERKCVRDGIEPRLGSKARWLEAIFTRLEKLDARLEIFEPGFLDLFRRFSAIFVKNTNNFFNYKPLVSYLKTRRETDPNANRGSKLKPVV